ncbi:hypothetical protein ATKI12_8440 [Kitasatospora sp. Ki12]
MCTALAPGVGAPIPPSPSGSAHGGELCDVLCHLYAMLSCIVE